MERATIEEQLETMEAERRERLAPKTIQGRDGVIRKLFQDFEKLVFAIAKMDGQVTTEQLLQKSAYDFYRYKQLLAQHHQAMRKR